VLIRRLAGSALVAIVTIGACSHQAQPPACPTPSLCGARQYCSADQRCICILTAEGDHRCGELPSSCNVLHCKTSSDCASLGAGYFCDTPDSGCCSDKQLSRCIAPCRSADGGDAGTPDGGMTSRQEFDAHFTAMESAIENSDLVIQSNNSFTKLADYQAIVAMGKRALPFVMEKLAAGDTRLIRAAEKITQVDVYGPLRSRPDLTNPPVSDADLARAWVDWWQIHKNDPQWQP
jgi:hypothetical protein